MKLDSILLNILKNYISRLNPKMHLELGNCCRSNICVRNNGWAKCGLHVDVTQNFTATMCKYRSKTARPVLVKHTPSNYSHIVEYKRKAVPLQVSQVSDKFD